MDRRIPEDQIVNVVEDILNEMEQVPSSRSSTTFSMSPPSGMSRPPSPSSSTVSMSPPPRSTISNRINYRFLTTPTVQTPQQPADIINNQLLEEFMRSDDEEDVEFIEALESVEQRNQCLTSTFQIQHASLNQVKGVSDIDINSSVVEGLLHYTGVEKLSVDVARFPAPEVILLRMNYIVTRNNVCKRVVIFDEIKNFYDNVHNTLLDNLIEKDYVIRKTVNRAINSRYLLECSECDSKVAHYVKIPCGHPICQIPA